MKENIFMNSDCLTEKQLISYKAHNLSSNELRKIEEHLIDCPLCSDAVEGTENIILQKMQNDIKLVKSKVKNCIKKKIPVAFIYSAVAALILITATAIFNISQPSNTEKLFNKYFEVYPDVTVHKRGFEKNSKLADAMDFYNKKQYQKASKIFKQIIEISNNETAIFYRGVSLMALNRMNNAFDEFLKICNNAKSNFYSEANWYAALSLIYSGKADKAKIYLLRLKNNPDYGEKASNILKQFTGLE